MKQDTAKLLGLSADSPTTEQVRAIMEPLAEEHWKRGKFHRLPSAKKAFMVGYMIGMISGPTDYRSKLQEKVKSGEIKLSGITPKPDPKGN